MTPVREANCPTCRRPLVRLYPNGEFDIEGKTDITCEVGIPTEVPPAAVLHGTPLLETARCSNRWRCRLVRLVRSRPAVVTPELPEGTRWF